MLKLFGRKKKKDEEEVEEEKPKKKKKRRRRKKKKKPKQWGKKERIYVILFFLITVVPSAVLALSSRSWKLPGFPRIKKPEIELPFLTSEKIVIEGDGEDIKKQREVEDRFNELTKELTGVYGLYVVDLDSGFSYGINDEEVFQAASLMKLPVMVGMYLEAENGGVDLDDTYTLKVGDKTPGSGELEQEEVGYEIGYRELIELMGKQSDNTAWKIASDYLGEERIKEVVDDVGMINTNYDENVTTPRDVGNFFEEVYRGNVLSEENSQELLRNLTDTIYEQWLAEGLPDEVRIAHKYGRETNVVNDAGIVYAEEPYVVAVMSKGVVGGEADEIFPQISEMVHEVETKY